MNLSLARGGLSWLLSLNDGFVILSLASVASVCLSARLTFTVLFLFRALKLNPSVFSIGCGFGAGWDGGGVAFFSVIAALAVRPTNSG